MLDVEEVQLAGDGELITRSPYVAWKREDTRIVNYILARLPKEATTVDVSPTVHKLLSKGWRMAPTARDARAEVQAEFGKILEENAAGDYVFFRVNKKAA